MSLRSAAPPSTATGRNSTSVSHAAGTAAEYRGVMNAERRELAFLVRMWLPQGARGEGEWRGSIQEVASGKRLFVTCARDIADFIAVQLAAQSENGD